MATESKTEAPTPRKREKAREEGRAAVSRDLTAGLALLAVCVAASRCWPSVLNGLATAAEGSLQIAGEDIADPEALFRIIRMWELVAARAVLPIVGVGAILGLIVGLAQTKMMFSLKTLQPNLEKLSPVSGMKRIFSIRGLVEAAKGILKVSLIMGMVAWVLTAQRERFIQLTDCTTGSAVALVMDLVFLMVLRCAELLVIIGIADYAYQWWEYERSLKMSRHEITDELKQMEGDPQMRARRKSLRRNMLQQGISRQMPEANVVVTNPTHIAVALMYQQGMVAPKVVAKGRHLIAERIVGLANKHGIPIVQNVEVARTLYKATSVGDYIPGQLFQIVAEILAVIFRKAQERRRRHAAHQGGRSRSPLP